jgi:tetratricopeptide (TPR) repeat protein
MSTWLRLSRALMLAVAFALLSSAARAQGSDDAGAHFDRGVSFFKDGDYTAAMVEFKKAYDVDPNYRVLYNLGQTSRELRDYASALTSFERYLAEGGTQIDPDRRKRVEGWIAELRGKIANVKLTSNVAGAEVSVDDVVVGTTPLERPIVVNAGRRKIALVLSGHSPRTQYVDVAGTETKDLRLDLVPLAAPDKPATRTEAPPPAPTPGESTGTARPWVMLGVTAAVGTAAAVMGGLALAKKSDFEDTLQTYPTSEAAIDDARSSARTFAAVADVLAAVAVAGGVTTIVLFASEPSGPAASPRTSVRAPQTSVHVGPRGIALSRRF